MTKHFKVNQSDSTKSKKNLKTHVHIVLDRSGSMTTCRQSTIDGFNEYINTLRSDTDGKYFVTLTQFDTDIKGPRLEDTFTDIQLEKVPTLTQKDFEPSGMTPLHDATGISLNESKRRLSAKKGTNTAVVVIMTDGGENASKEYRAETIKKMIDECEADGWTVTYMGANQNAEAIGGSLGFKVGKMRTYDTGNMAAAFSRLAGSTVQRRTAYTKTLDTMDYNATVEDVTRAFADTSSEVFFKEDDNEDS